MSNAFHITGIAALANITFDSADAAMKAYAQHGFQGTIVPGAAPNRAARRAAPAPAVQLGAFNQPISPIAQARINRHESMLANMGIALPPPIYAAGTRVVALGDENFRQSRMDWEESEETVEGLRGLWRTIRNENREDVTVAVRDMKMLDNGLLLVDGEELAVEGRALKQLVSRGHLWPHGGAYLAAIRPDERAWNFNTRIERSGSGNADTLVLRIREFNNVRQIFAAVSEGYTSFDGDLIAEKLGNELKGSGMRGPVVYNPDTTGITVEGVYHADTVVDLAAGDVFKTGIRWSANDAASGSIKGDAIAWRNLCLNLIIIGEGKKNLVRRVHRGSLNDIRSDVQHAARQGARLFRSFADEWNVLRNTDARDFYGVGTAREVMEALVGERKFDGPARAGESKLVDVLLSTLAEEPGSSLADMINAVTRVHALDAISDIQRERMEKTAGMLVPVLAKRAAA